MKLSRLTVKNYRSLREHGIELSDLNLFIGANASGKSTILDALRFLNEGVRTRDFREPVFHLFTLAHELAHIWLGESALSNSEPRHVPGHDVERWCNLVAAEVLAPIAVFHREHDANAELREELDRLARRFKVSTLVVLRRIRDVGALTPEAYRAAYTSELDRIRRLPRGGGGNFYLTLGARVSKRFAHAMVVSTLEGRSSFTEAFRLLGFKKMETFRKLGANLGVTA